jgi:hypothetical protein
VLELLGTGAAVLATWDPDELFDYRARRPTLEIRDGALARLTWPEITLRAARFGGRDVLVLSGAEPDDQWRRSRRPSSCSTPGVRVDQPRLHPAAVAHAPGADHGLPPQGLAAAWDQPHGPAQGPGAALSALR